MRDSFLAVDAATDLRARARELRRGWEAMFTGTSTPGLVRPVVARSWSRMRGAGLDPERLRPQAAIAADELEAVRLSSPLRHALPALRHHLGGIAEDAEHVVVITDAAGRILWLEGHPRVLEGAQSIEFRPGMLWTETSAGTNAIGTALAIDHPVQIFSAEHFLPDQHGWWCSAAPLHDPATGELVGVIDVSGPQRTAHPYSLTLVTVAARIAEDVLREHLVRQLHRVERDRLDQGPLNWRLPASTDASRPEPRARLALRLLGRHGHTWSLDGSGPHELSLRHAEVLALLALYPEGLSAEQLTLHLYGERGKPVSTRALMSRLRTLLGGCLLARPYRLAAEVHADFLEVLTLLKSGATTRALAAYAGPLLVESEVRRIEDVRNELAAALRRVALDGTTDELWAWLETGHGREDPEAMNTFLAEATEHDSRRDVITARLRALNRSWEID